MSLLVDGYEGKHCDVAKWQNCQQVKYEYQKPVGSPLEIPMLEWKWERMVMDFLVGLLKTLGMFDSLQVVVNRLTKLTHFTSVNVDYNAE